MRFLLSAFLLLGYSIGLSCNSGSAVQISDEDIAEAVFRFQIERCYESNPSKLNRISETEVQVEGACVA
jgi:hypothetical protein